MSNTKQLAFGISFTLLFACLPARAETKTTVRQQDYHKCMEEESKNGSLASTKYLCCSRVGGTWVEVDSKNSIADSYCEVSGEAMPVTPGANDPRKPKNWRKPVGPRSDTVEPGAKSTPPVDPTLRQKVVPAPKNAAP